MKTKWASFTLALILVFGMISLVDMGFEVVPKVEGATITVDDSGGADHTNIHDAIDAAYWGDTVYVYSGTYNEQIVIDKTIDLIGQNKDTTVIEGTYFNNVVTIIVDYVNLIGFKILGCSYNNDGIILNNVQNCVISDNIISENNYGVALYSSNSNEISNNIVKDNFWNGIRLENSIKNIIKDNDISSTEFDGLHLVSSNENTISGNIVYNNIYNHIYLQYSNDNIISDNTISPFGYGIHLDKSTGNSISKNTMTNNGIFIEGDHIDYWNTHNIDMSNTLNGKPVYYLKNQNGGNISTAAGQVILANCTNFTIANQDFNIGIVGIELGFSHNNSIINIESGRNWGIIVEHSNDNLIIESSFGIGEFGILSFSSQNNILINCTFYPGIMRSLGFYGNSHIIGLNTFFYYPKFYDTLSTLTVKWFLHVNVTDFQGNPVPNAKVIIKDNQNGEYNKTFITNATGEFNWIPQTEYIEQKSGKIYYTPHKIMAWNDTLIGFANPDPLMDQSKTVNIVLHNGTQLDLESGWNLISLPRPQSDTNLQTVLQSIEGRYDAVQWYNVSDNSDPWKDYHVSKPPQMNDLHNLNNNMGFWLHVTDPEGTSLVVFGSELTSNNSIELQKGWNLVGYPSLSIPNRTVGLNNLEFDTHVDAIQWFNSTSKTWHFMEENDSFEIGRGYWIHATQDCVWEVPL